MIWEPESFPLLCAEGCGQTPLTTKSHERCNRRFRLCDFGLFQRRRQSNRWLAEEISVRSNSGAKAADGSDEKALFTIKFLIAEINRLERTLYRHYDTLARFIVERN